MDVDAGGPRLDHDGRTYHFCSEHCRDRFRTDPDAFTGDPTSATARPDQAQDVEYTCPMHPEIRQIGLRNCPICGMALEPVTVAAEEGPSAELVDMTRRFWAALALTLPVVVLEMGSELIGALDEAVPDTLSTWLQNREMAGGRPSSIRP
jgi:Cu+-exporting ATPase